MPLVPMRLLLDHAAANSYGLAAFNVNNMEQIRAIMEAADANNAIFAGTTLGASFALLRFTVTVAVPVRPPASVACTVSVKVGVDSKSSAAFATVIAPVVGLIVSAGGSPVAL